ncbi:hypothetical protein EDB92DRAFT_1812870 [Lactarius akahatsu]|uniref:Uncharacterized protein n=1 Tax=Lactarius akahatsu TaxID=416441 RepID=A0AAD4LTC1_9AGAM|nr:hypothetical protein EDB92DRAFT_1812870 [Lactarius akahatsu]
MTIKPLQPTTVYGWGYIGELRQEALASVHVDVAGPIASWPELLPLVGNRGYSPSFRGVSLLGGVACGRGKRGWAGVMQLYSCSDFGFNCEVQTGDMLVAGTGFEQFILFAWEAVSLSNRPLLAHCRLRLLATSMMGDSSIVVLQCIEALDINNCVDGHPFPVDVPRKGSCGDIIGCMVKATPSLQCVDYKRIRLYKPPSSHSIPISYSLDKLLLTTEHFLDPLYPYFTVEEKFPEKESGDGCRFIIDVIISGTGTSAHTALPGWPSGEFLTCVTFKLRAHVELLLPPDDLLRVNGLIKSPDKGKPDFIKQLEKDLSLQHAAIGFNGANAHKLCSLEALLGESFGEYFTDSSDGPEMCHVSNSELLHYVVALSDSHLGDAVTFITRPENHIYRQTVPGLDTGWQKTTMIILYRFIDSSQIDTGLQCGTSWIFNLVVEVEGEVDLYKGFPHLVAKVVSDRGGGKDKNRMLLQASCLVRLGNALLKGKPPEFAVKAIYFDCHFYATEYTLYQRGTGPDSKVKYSQDEYNLSERRELFVLVFRLYNFRLSMVALHGKLSKDLVDSLSSIQRNTNHFPAITSSRSLSNSIGSSLKRKRSTGPVSMGGRLDNLHLRIPPTYLRGVPTPTLSYLPPLLLFPVPPPPLLSATILMNDDSMNVQLFCVVVDDSLKVCGSSFTILVPSGGLCGRIISCVVEVTPSLQGVDHKRFRVYKPPSSHPINTSDSLDGLQLTEEHLTDPLLPPYTVKKMFQEKFQENGDDHRLSVDVIVCVDSEGEAGIGGAALHLLSAASRNRFLTCAMLRLRAQTELQLLSDVLLGINGLTETPVREAPDFVKQLEEELCLQHSLSCHGAALPLLGSLKALLGGSFGKYFADPSDEPEMHPVSDIELLHYVDILLDHQLSSQGAYRDKVWLHVYSLLRRFTVPSPLRCDAQLLLDFSMVVKGFPYLLLGVYSDKSHREGVHLMLLQASCLVHLGNALLTGGSSMFFVKVVYIDRDYHAVEYTLYQRGPKPCDDSDDKVAALPIVTWKLTAALPSILSEVEYLPYLTGGHSCDRSSSSAPTSLVAQGSSETAATLLNPRVRAAIQRGGTRYSQEAAYG